MKKISQEIKKEYDDAIIIYSPEWHGIIDIFIDQYKGEIDVAVKEDDEDYEDDEDSEDELEEEETVEEEIVEDDIIEEDVIDDDEVEEKDDEKDEENGVEYKQNINLIDTINVATMPEDIIPSDLKTIEYMEDKVLPVLLTINISGIQGIQDIFY